MVSNFAQTFILFNKQTNKAKTRRENKEKQGETRRNKEKQRNQTVTPTWLRSLGDAVVDLHCNALADVDVNVDVAWQAGHRDWSVKGERACLCGCCGVGRDGHSVPTGEPCQCVRERW